ncbi:SusC/RagA family TonB-linked outer membrane protein [uncultured Mucilaginibacter sp.]|uniref:SusC/RagA family TonB-linked outer membrane protein n=1 Tax=uncultured Mucilaginibacter sp. TaxID=797541 RepID=UPI0025D7B350|nr:SusC/RagA family TonB-linked outer membrane protein [uncultured Mucilaginibacter sp.]
MKLTVIMVMAVLLQVSAGTYAQKLTFKKNGATLREVFGQIRVQTGYNVLYSPDLINEESRLNANFSNATLRNVLDQIIDRDALSYTIDRKNILITKAKEESLLQKVIDLVETTSILGKVSDENGKPLPGATISVKGTRNSVVADAEGAFAITVNEAKDILVISFIGYEIKELPAKNIKSPLLISLKQSTSNLDQVQITAYGTTTKRLNTGNITTVTAQEIAKNPVNNVMEALQGKVPGLFIQQVTGQPGGAFNLRIRGSANLTTGATSPLVIVDGVRYPASTLKLSENTSYGTKDFLQGGSGLNFINPNDIETIDVLKDIDATAIYGSSGAYGVILITTKKNKHGSQSFDANVYTGVSVYGSGEPLLNTEEYLMLRREALKNDGTTTIPSGDSDLNGTWPQDRYTDWRKLFMGGHAATTNVNLSYNGSARNTSYLISGSFRDIGNIQRHKGANRDGSLRFALNTSTNNNKFSLSLTGTYLASVNDMVPYDFSTSSLLVPNAPNPYNADGSVNWAAIGTDVNSSASSSNANRLYKNNTNNLLANATLIYRPMKKLTLRTIFGYSDITGKELIGYPLAVFNPTNTAAATQTTSIFHHYNTRSITVSPYAEYRTALGSKGNLTAKIGGEISNIVTYLDDITGTGFPSDALLKNPSAGSSVVTDYNLTEYRSIGTYGILKYVWNNKYIVDLNVRRDGSTKFGSGRRFGTFGSAAAAWIFTEEKFLKDNKILSFGKLRASTGTVGGDAVGDFNYLSTYNVTGGSYDGKVGLSPGSLSNPYLVWERNTKSEIALELGFLKDRIFIEGSYYYNKAGNQLIGTKLSSVTGFGSYSLNSDAVISTSGIEGILSTTNIKSKNFQWTTRVNISIPRSKLIKVPTNATLDANLALGKPVTGIFLYKYNGVNPATGYYNFTNAKGVASDYLSGLTQADKTEFVDLAPKYFGGIQNSFSYKQLSVDFSFTVTSRKGRNFLGQTVFPFGIYGLNGSAQWLKRWQKPGDETDFPKLSANLLSYFRQTNFQASTGAYSDATYARLQNLSIRYNFKGSYLQKLGISNLSVYLQGQNLLTISKFGGLDPENLAAGVIPPLRVFTGGFNVTF